MVLFMNSIMQRINDFVASTVDIDGKIDALITWFKTFPELAKIGIILLLLLIVFLGTLRLLKKLLIDLPKKLFFIILFAVFVYFILVWL